MAEGAEARSCVLACRSAVLGAAENMLYTARESGERRRGGSVGIVIIAACEMEFERVASLPCDTSRQPEVHSCLARLWRCSVSGLARPCGRRQRWLPITKVHHDAPNRLLEQLDYHHPHLA